MREEECKEGGTKVRPDGRREERKKINVNGQSKTTRSQIEGRGQIKLDSL